MSGRTVPIVQRIHHYSIKAPSEIIEATRQFYKSILDLRDGYRPDFGLDGYWLYAGDEPILHLITIAKNNEDSSQASGENYFDHIALRCNGLNNMIKKLEAHQIEFGRLDIKAVNQVQLFITDPAGVKVELNFSEATN